MVFFLCESGAFPPFCGLLRQGLEKTEDLAVGTSELPKSPKCETSKDGRPFRDEGSQHPRDFQRKGISPSQNLKNFFADMLGVTLRRENMYIYI